jgi:hypothetical protein
MEAFREGGKMPRNLDRDTKCKWLASRSALFTQSKLRPGTHYSLEAGWTP